MCFPRFNVHFPGEPGLAVFIEAKDDGDGGENWTTGAIRPTPLPTNIVTPNPLHTSLLAPKYIYAHCLFRLLFLSIISTAYHLLSGSQAARLLLKWLIDWLIVQSSSQIITINKPTPNQPISMLRVRHRVERRVWSRGAEYVGWSMAAGVVYDEQASADDTSAGRTSSWVDRSRWPQRLPHSWLDCTHPCSY